MVVEVGKNAIRSSLGWDSPHTSARCHVPNLTALVSRPSNGRDLLKDS